MCVCVSVIVCVGCVRVHVYMSAHGCVPQSHTHLSNIQELLPCHYPLLPLLGVHRFRGILNDGLQVGQTVTNLEVEKYGNHCMAIHLFIEEDIRQRETKATIHRRVGPLPF